MRKNNAAEFPQATVGEPVFVGLAYHDGPPEIHFAGRRWQRGVAQPVTIAELEGVRPRRDFSAYRFTEQFSSKE